MAGVDPGSTAAASIAAVQSSGPCAIATLGATGNYPTPGLIDTNGHISLGGSMESNIRYQDRRFDMYLGPDSLRAAMNRYLFVPVTRATKSA